MDFLKRKILGAYAICFMLGLVFMLASDGSTPYLQIAHIHPEILLQVAINACVFGLGACVVFRMLYLVLQFASVLIIKPTTESMPKQDAFAEVLANAVRSILRFAFGGFLPIVLIELAIWPTFSGSAATSAPIWRAIILIAGGPILYSSYRAAMVLADKLAGRVADAPAS